MKAFIYTLMLLGMVLADPVGNNQAKVGDDPVVKNTELNKWMSPALASGYLTFFFLMFISYNAFLLLGAIQVPAYQLEKPKDEKDAKNQFEHIWGNIEK